MMGQKIARCVKCDELTVLVDGLCSSCVRKFNNTVTIKNKIARQKLKNALVEVQLAEGYAVNYQPLLLRVTNIRKRLQTTIKIIDSTIKHQEKIMKNEN